MIQKHNWNLSKEVELRIYVPEDAQFEIKLRSGDAEIFGYELVPEQSYPIPPGTHVAVVSWGGAVIDGHGNYEHAYTSKENISLLTLNLHGLLTIKRREARNLQETGPKVLVCGAMDVGKSTLCTIFANYSVRSNFPIIAVDLDIGQGEILPPGSIGAVLIDQPFLPNQDKSTHCPLAYFYGHVDINEQPDLYTMHIKNLADGVFQKLSHSPKIKSSGFIVNTCGYVVKYGLEALKIAIEAFEIDLVIVIDSELLYSQLKGHYKGKRAIVEIPKSGGVINIDRKVRKKLRNERIANYFYGIDKGFHPHSSVFGFDEVKFYKIGRPSVSDFCLPMGSDIKKLNLEILKVDLEEELIYSLCAMSCGETQEEVLSSNVYGFVVISNIDMENKKVTLMSPGPPPFPSKNFIVGSIKYIDIR